MIDIKQNQQAQKNSADQDKIRRMMAIYDRFHKEVEALRLEIRRMVNEELERERQDNLSRVRNRILSL